MLGSVILHLCGTGELDTCLSVAPLDKSRAIKAGVRIAAPEYIFPALILQCFTKDFLRCSVIKAGSGEVLRHQPYIEHVPVSVTPAAVFLYGNLIFIADFHAAGFPPCKTHRQLKGIFLPLSGDIADKAAAVIVGLYDRIDVTAACLCGF